MKYKDGKGDSKWSTKMVREIVSECFGIVVAMVVQSIFYLEIY